MRRFIASLLLLGLLAGLAAGCANRSIQSPCFSDIGGAGFSSGCDPRR